MSPQNPRHAYGVALVALLSLIPAAHAQSACGLQGYSSCGTGTQGGSGCCPTDWQCYATECSYTGTSTMSAPPTRTACPGVPAHHLCPQSLGGNCCYNAHACDPDNVSQCILTQTQRVFEGTETSTTVVDGTTQTITSTTLFYPWLTVTPRVTFQATASSEETTAAPETTAPEATTAPTTTEASSSISTGAAGGHAEARIGGVLGGILAGLLV
ncbi:hypothetical protein F5144DRAFT_605620 [Chaetomium tenue]|uniref:Uncharacterized protein n=1 Tax=Chaetomium tenue TaxID=1854479 RepID=A0ACB7P0M4_9PEZI|nr:hypothetical protein F5144DRAFT_605620 [Chaetomium globosum]